MRVPILGRIRALRETRLLLLARRGKRGVRATYHTRATYLTSITTPCLRTRRLLLPACPLRPLHGRVVQGRRDPLRTRMARCVW